MKYLKSFLESAELIGSTSKLDDLLSRKRNMQPIVLYRDKTQKKSLNPRVTHMELKPLKGKTGDDKIYFWLSVDDLYPLVVEWSKNLPDQVLVKKPEKDDLLDYSISGPWPDLSTRIDGFTEMFQKLGSSNSTLYNSYLTDWIGKNFC